MGPWKRQIAEIHEAVKVQKELIRFLTAENQSLRKHNGDLMDRIMAMNFDQYKAYKEPDAIVAASSLPEPVYNPSYDPESAGMVVDINET